MKFLYNFFILLFTLISSTSIYSQSLKKSNERELFKIIKKTINDLEKKDIKELSKNSTEKIYCLLCFNKISNNKKPEIHKKEFYEKKFQSIFDKKTLQKINQNSERIIIEQNSEFSNYIVLFTIYKANEISRGHEGSQLGIWFKNKNGKFLISGFEIIP